MGLVELLLMIAPYCTSSPLEDECKVWMVECILYQDTEDLGRAEEICSENIPEEYLNSLALSLDK